MSDIARGQTKQAEGSLCRILVHRSLDGQVVNTYQHGFESTTTISVEEHTSTRQRTGYKITVTVDEIAERTLTLIDVVCRVIPLRFYERAIDPEHFTPHLTAWRATYLFGQDQEKGRVIR